MCKVSSLGIFRHTWSWLTLSLSAPLRYLSVPACTVPIPVSLSHFLSHMLCSSLFTSLTLLTSLPNHLSLSSSLVWVHSVLHKHTQRHYDPQRTHRTCLSQLGLTFWFGWFSWVVCLESLSSGYRWHFTMVFMFPSIDTAGHLVFIRHSLTVCGDPSCPPIPAGDRI